MKCQYTFRVRGHFEVDESYPVTVDSWTYEFVTEGFRVVAIRIVIPVPKGTPLPKVLRPKGTSPAEFRIVEPFYPDVLSALRTALGLLTVYHAVEIDTASPEVTWLPESPAEADRLALYSFAEVPMKLRPRLTFKAVLQCVAASRQAGFLELALSFYRRGQLAFHDGDYIQAIYYYFFVLESTFGGGNWRRQALEQALLSTPVVVSSITSIQADPSAILSAIAAPWTKSPEKIIEHFVKLRGTLHHHYVAAPDRWHPDDPRRYQMDAACLAELVTHIIISLASPSLFSAETKALVAALRAKPRDE